jgi:hypothetical protein
MQPLDKTLRNRLERTIKEARDVAEDAVRAALDQLGVAESAPFAHMGEPERVLRRKLRAHGRHLGDSLNGGKVQSMDLLVEETAYEHWHRMLFARFLAENNLLMYWPEGDDTPIDIDLETCQGLLDDGEEEASSVWELVARFAARMLPQIFRPDSPVFQLILPPEFQQKLERLVADLPREVFTASDSIGWVYQFWQAKRKDEVNASEVKIGARELPAVTQLFTEPYMVSFLLDNSLGAWWAARRLSEADLKNAQTEEELRQKAAIPGVPLKYLRFVRQEDGAWTPAAGTFDGWPEQLADLKTLDPCCGSGHFLVAAFLMLVPMRVELDGLSPQEAVDAVLRENIHGLELDKRCVELAAFALALAAWTYTPVTASGTFGFAGSGLSGFDQGTFAAPLGYRPLPELNLACSGIAISAKKEDWLALAGDNVTLKYALEELYKQFKDAPILGSLINPEASLGKGSLMELQWDEVGPLLTKVLAGEHDEEMAEMGVVARGVSQAANILIKKYSLVTTNVPYLARGRQKESLQEFCERHHSAAKSDLATVFLDRCLELCAVGGTSSIVLPQNWLFLTTYKNFRKTLLKNELWHLIARLGAGAFETISGEIVKAILISLSRGNLVKESGAVIQAFRDSNIIHGVDVSESRTAGEKAESLIAVDIKSVVQSKQLKNPDARITLEIESNPVLLSEYAACFVGIQTGDDPKYLSAYWEQYWPAPSWVLLQHTPSSYTEYAGQSWLIKWDGGNGALHASRGARIQGLEAVGKSGVAIHRMGTIFPYHFSKTHYHQNIAVILPAKEDHLPAIWSFCSSHNYSEAIRRIDQKLNITNATLVKVPFDLDHWTKVSAEQYPNGLPKPYSDEPTQWIFHGHPCGSVVWNDEIKWTAQGQLRTDDTVLQVAVARLLGYRWPMELNADMELADEQREWVKRCDALLSFVDDDGIVCIPPVRGEEAASDRLLSLLAAAYGDAWSNETLATLLANVDHAGKTLETWLREKFFTQHCKLFQHRPFIWHIWDGLRDGFSALINYHKLDAKLLETLIYTYLGDWISRQKRDIASGIDGAEERLAAAERLKKSLELILEGETPYDIFVRWKPLEKQPIGWNPDLNDGVRLNIRPFLTVPDVGKKGAGVLRDKPNIKWDKDRGKDVESAPWYQVFNGDRMNDHHLSLAEKRAARTGEKA